MIFPDLSACRNEVCQVFLPFGLPLRPLRMTWRTIWMQLSVLIILTWICMLFVADRPHSLWFWCVHIVLVLSSLNLEGSYSYIPLSYPKGLLVLPHCGNPTDLFLCAALVFPFIWITLVTFSGSVDYIPLRCGCACHIHTFWMVYLVVLSAVVIPYSDKKIFVLHIQFKALLSYQWCPYFSAFCFHCVLVPFGMHLRAPVPWPLWLVRYSFGGWSDTPIIFSFTPVILEFSSCNPVFWIVFYDDHHHPHFWYPQHLSEFPLHNYLSVPCLLRVVCSSLHLQN